MNNCVEQQNVCFALKNENGSDWSPVLIQNLSSVIKIPMTRRNNAYTTSKNIAYSLQYIQYLQKQLDSICLTDVLNKMVCKNYIITAMSIIEAIFAYLVKKTNNWKMSEWKSIHKNKLENQKEVDIGSKTLKIVTEVFEKVEPYDIEVQFDAIIDKIKSKKLIVFESNEFFDIIKKFKALRNKIHLHITQDTTDYKLFDKPLQIKMKYILQSILKNRAVCSNSTKASEVYSFLNLTTEEKELVGIK